MSEDNQSASLYPTRGWLENNDVMAKFINSVAVYAARDIGSEQARTENAAKVYLAFCLGLQEAGLLAIQHAPILWVDVGEIAYKISLNHDGSTASITSMVSHPISSPVNSFFDATSGGNDRSNLVETQALSLAKVAEVRLVSFLEGIREQLVKSPVSGRVQQIATASSDLLPPSCPPAQPHGIAELESVAHSLLRLDGIDLQTERLVFKINDSYLTLGQAYGRTVGATNNGRQGWKVAHTSQNEILQKLAAFQGLAYLATSKGRLAWSKRLQRAHKFCLLVDIFGEGILEATPAVSVSRLDRISLLSLEKSESGGTGSDLVFTIKLLLNV